MPAHEGGNSFAGSVNTSLHPDDNGYPVAATYDRPANKMDQDESADELHSYLKKVGIQR